MADFGAMGGYGDLGAGVLGGIGAFFGDLAGEGNREKARKYLELSRQGWEGIDPTVRASIEDVVTQGPSAYEGLATQLDPAARDAQTRAYRALMDRGLSGGMDAQSRAALADAQAESAGQESGQRQAILQAMAGRGRVNSGASLAAQLANSQAAAERGNRAATQAAGDASARAYQALAQGGQLAGQARGQDYQQASDRAQAADLIAEHNARNRQGVYQRNADRTQGAAESTVNNRFRRQQGISQGYGAESDAQMAESDRRRRLGYGVGSTVGRGAGIAFGGL